MSLFNENKLLSPLKKEIIIRIISVVIILFIGALLIYIFLPYSNKIVKTLSTNEVIASCSLFLAIIALIIKSIEKVLRSTYSGKRKIALEVVVLESYVNITCKINNYGKKRIIPQNIYLYVQQGKEIDTLIEYPHLLRHEKGKYDCILASYCKKGGLENIPSQLIDTKYHGLYQKLIKLKYLNYEAIMFIDPSEEFTEDTVLKLEKGIYRVIAIWTSVKEDCICCQKEFIIEGT